MTEQSTDHAAQRGDHYDDAKNDQLCSALSTSSSGIILTKKEQQQRYRYPQSLMSRRNQGEQKKQPNESLRAHRLRKNWTQVYVATMIGTSHVEVSRWETGVAVPSLYFRDRLCELFGSTLEALGILSPAETYSPDAEDLAPVLWNIPYPRNPYFTGREEILAWLHEMLRVDATKSAQVQAITGLGGIGKTQTAIEYVYRYCHEYQAIFWVKADTRENLSADIAALAALLNLPEKEDRDQEQSIESVMNWLKIRTNWLIILDNVEDLAGVSEIFTVETGHFLLTTRSQITGTLARQLDLRKMEPEEGALFLLRRAKCLAPGESLEKARATERGVAAELSRMLDGLPLALDQAGAYIEETGCCLADYLELYRRQQAALLARRGRMSTDHPHSVMTTLNIASARAAQANPAALALLRLCAFLHPDAIPEELFTDASFSLDPVLQLMAEDPLALDAAMATLRCYSLLQRNPGNKTLTIHRLVQAVLRDRMNEEEQRQWAEHVVQMIAAAVPSIEGITGGAEWERGKRYFSQVLMSISLIETWKLQLSKAEQLLHWIGVYLNILGQYTQAESLLQKAMELARQSSGSEGPGIAEHMHELAVVYIYQGKYLQAEQLLLDALDIYTRALGSETFKAGECLNDLGALYIKQSQYTQKQLQCTQAEALLLHSLAICENILGSDHPHVAYPLTNLAVLYYHQGNYTQAEALNRGALRIREQALTVNHFLAAYNLLLLGMTYREQGHYAQAEPLLQQSLQVREESLGKEHAVVGQSLHELAMLYIRQGRFHEAFPLLQRALSIREQLGANHPDTLATSNAYADLLRRMDCM